MGSAPPLRVREPWHRRFTGLMPFRIREILLVSSGYDAFVLEEDGPLTERLFEGYSELSLSNAPRITHVTTMAAALDLLGLRRFDMVLTVVRVEDGDAGELASAVKAQAPDIPVVLLIFDEADLGMFPDDTPPDTIERSFLWTGDAGTLLAVIKLIEDLRNVEHDTAMANVQVILVVEDQIRAYSTFLALLYPEMLRQSYSMIQEGYNDLHRLLRMRARSKIILANDYEEAVVWHRWHKDNLLAVITDVRFPKDGTEVADAGFQLVEEIRRESPDLPVLVLSAEEDLAARAKEARAWWVEKASPVFPSQVRRFLKERLGFGNFIFRLPDGTEVARAQNVWEMEQAMNTAPAESIRHHATRNDFSVWLRARSMFELATEIRPKDVDDFEDIEEVRDYLVQVLRKARDHELESVISDVSAPPPGAETRFVRVGRGSIGGKGRGIAFTNSLIVRHALLTHFDGLQVRIPKTVILGTEAYERFVDDNAAALSSNGEADLRKWLQAEFDDEIAKQLEAALRALKGPLAVRSSSVLEDSRFQPFAGVYATYMLPNNHPHPHVRFHEVLQAIKAVYASTQSKAARTYVAGTPHGLEDQRMAIVIQQVVGAPYRDRWYPVLSGVAQSRNYYPVGHQQPEDGVAVVALGLGEMVAGGGTALRFSPGSPRVLPQYPDDRTFSRLSQTHFYGLDLSEPELDLHAGTTASLTLCDLVDAEADGTLPGAASVYCAADDVLRDNLGLEGPRVVTFNGILKYGELPLAEALGTLLRLLRDSVGSEVEIEFALDQIRPEGRDPRLYVLQLRPVAHQHHVSLDLDLDAIPPDRILIATRRALGHGVLEDVQDVIYVTRAALGSRETRRLARQVADLATALRDEGRPFLLIGPGRWGTSDPALGVPVDWRDIAGAKVIVETPLEDRHVEPSQGSHFFHNLTALRIGYLSLVRGSEGHYDQAWLDDLPAVKRLGFVRHVRLETPLLIQMDGTAGRAAILKPEPPGD